MTDNLERLRARDEHLAQWADDEIERRRAIEAAAKSLVVQKGRHHTQQAYEQLAALVNRRQL
jgi:hypothetical protein